MDRVSYIGTRKLIAKLTEGIVPVADIVEVVDILKWL